MNDNEKLYSIPGFKRYKITMSGKIWSHHSKRYLNPSLKKPGYWFYTLTDDTGHRWGIGRHRILCIAFKPLEGIDIRAMVVNHIDGVPGNDELDNLEWVTYQGNIEHAGLLGLTTKCIPCQVMNVDTGEIVKYPSAIKAARELKIPKDAILYRLQQGEDRVYPERNQYRIGWSDKVWLPNPDADKAILEYGNIRGVIVKDLDSGIITTFRSLTAVSEKFNISLGCLSKRLNKESQPWFQPNMLMKWETNQDDWRVITDKFVEYERSTCSKVVILVGENDNQIFLSAKECSKATGVKHSTVLWRVNSPSKPTHDGYKYYYYSDFHLVHLESNP